MALGVYTHPGFARHRTADGHPENAGRLDAAIEGVRRAGLASAIDWETDEHPETDAIIARVHSGELSERLKKACEEGRPVFGTPDNSISPFTWRAARAAVATALTAADHVWGEKMLRRAFVVARPPGHHAERSQAMGFCFFNTIACVAEWLRGLHGIDRVYILDWDVHHGNGTQQLFEERDDVFYASIHRYPFYPGTGSAGERGVGRGVGATLNLPLEGGAGDAVYLRAVETTIARSMREFAPDAVLISAGFDAHARDPLGGMRVSAEAFGTMTERVAEIAADVCDGRLLSILEGGYDREGLAASVSMHVDALARRRH